MDKFEVRLLKEDAKELKILYVDSNKDAHKSLLKWLEKYFKDVTTVESAKSAISLFDKGFFDIIISNTSLPDMDIVSFCSKIKRITRRKSIVVFSQKDDNKDMLKELINLGISGYLNYPFDIEDLTHIISQIVNDITDTKLMYTYHDSYIEMLENMINASAIKKESDEVKKDISSNTPPKTNIIAERNKKISAVEFIEQLECPVVDKTDIFLEEMDNFAITLYDIEESDTNISLLKLKEAISTLNHFSYIVEKMVHFPIILDTFNSLVSFLDSLTIKELDAKSTKTFLTEALLGLEKDIRMWIRTIFIEKSADNIHYFDASFANSALEIEALFK